MLYRSFPRSEEKFSVLGFGCMRLPTLPNGAIDEPRAERLLRAGFDGGINYFDAAWPYHEGKCEEFVGRAVEGFRDQITLVSKLPVWLVEKPSDMESFLDQQLKNLRTDHLDIYLLHSMNAERWEKMQCFGALDFLEKARTAGKIRRIGFSFHDGIAVFKEILGAYPWDMCQIQYNLLDRDFQAGREGLRLAAQKDVGVVVMEPLKGGNISLPVPEELRSDADEAMFEAPNLADLALRWVWDQPEVSLLLSGMTTEEQLAQNLKSADRGAAGGLSDKERRFADRVQAWFQSRMKVPCTSCAYCKPCPQGVDIPQCFTNLNNAALSGNWEAQTANYRYLFSPVREARPASFCVGCGECLPKCPQGIPIPERLKEVKAAFEQGWDRSSS